MIGMVGCLDWATGNELSVSIFYLLPIAYAAWFVSQTAGMLLAAMCATLWFILEVSVAPNFSHPFVPIWNAGMRLMVFMLGIGLVCVVKRTEQETQLLMSERTRRLREESETRRRLEQRMLEMSAREHVRMAEDLHDGLGQYLSALTFQARMLSEDLRQQGSPLAERAEWIVALIRKTNQITRRIDQALRVPAGGPDGLFAALGILAAEFEQLTGVRFELVPPAKPLVLDEFRTLMLFRIVQEAFSNAVKHGNPRLIRTSLTLDRSALTIFVVDDGQKNPSPDDTLSGTGLRIMKLRAELIGARLEAGTSPGGGFRVQCVLPLSEVDRSETGAGGP